MRPDAAAEAGWPIQTLLVHVHQPWALHHIGLSLAPACERRPMNMYMHFCLGHCIALQCLTGKQFVKTSACMGGYTSARAS